MVIGWTVLTAVLLVSQRLGGADGGALLPAAVTLVYVWFRLIDTASQKLMEILAHSIRPPLFAGIQRSVVLGILNLYEIIACYAIIYLANGGIQRDGESLATATSAFYFSIVTALTVGYGDFVPITDGARMLVISEIVVVAIFIVAWFPRVVSLLFPARSQ